MEYTVQRIDEDIDYGCEERTEDSPVMAVVTLQDEAGIQKKIRQEDRMLYYRNINEGDRVIINEKSQLQKVHFPKKVQNVCDGVSLTGKMV